MPLSFSHIESIYWMLLHGRQAGSVLSLYLNDLILPIPSYFTDQEIGTSEVTPEATVLFTPWHCLHSVSFLWCFGLINSHPNTVSLVIPSFAQLLTSSVLPVLG